MGTVRKTITLRVKAQIEAGHTTKDSEYIRDLPLSKQERNAEVEAIRAALQEGESSGKPRIFNTEVFKQRMLTTHG